MPVKTTIYKEVTQRDLTIYCKRQGWINQLQKRNKEINERLRATVLDGKELPAEGPYLIELAPNGGKELDWEAQYQALLIDTLMKTKKMSAMDAVLEAAKKVNELKTNAPDKTPVTVLGKAYVGGFKMNVKQNPQYRQTKQVA